jgi:hypothetical protein
MGSEIDEESIENASTEWEEWSDKAKSIPKYPFVKVARISIPLPQANVNSEDNIAHCEKMAFTPWHSLVEHQPIGSINRLRKDVYAASAKHRLKQPESMPFFIRLLEKFFKSLFG